MNNRDLQEGSPNKRFCSIWNIQIPALDLCVKNRISSSVALCVSCIQLSPLRCVQDLTHSVAKTYKS